MKKIKKIIRFIRKPKNIIIYLLNKPIFKFISDMKFIELKYKLEMKKTLNFNNPQTFNEKLQWLKLYDRNPIYTQMVDKYSAKEYVANIIGDEYIIPTIAIYDKFDNIEWDKLPNKFVIKCTHDSGGLVICKNKKALKKEEARKKINKCLKRNYFYQSREWPYKNVEPKILIEKYMEDKEDENLKDYKIFCFNGKVKTILVCSNRKGSFKNTDFFDCNWKLQPFHREKHKNSPQKIKKPEKLEEMLQIAEKLSSNIPFVRVDLYEINGKVYFGELTFYPSSGLEGFEPQKYDKILGDMLELPINEVDDKDEK